MTTNGSGKRKTPSYVNVDGLRLAGGWYVPAYRDFLKYKCKDDDVFLVTYPKCGTTWMHYITFLIHHNGEPPKDGKEFAINCPFPEAMGIELVDHMSRPGVIKTHLPFHLTPYSPKAKYIYVVRNPKDCCVSFYHHTVTGGVYYDFEDGEFDDYFECFIEGNVDYGDYFDSVLSWYEHRNDPNVLMVTYEEMKTNTANVVVRVAKFLGEELGQRLESDPQMVEKILKNSSVSSMKAAFALLMDDMQSLGSMNLTPALSHLSEIMKNKNKSAKEFTLVRKGIIGDWRNIMTTDQIRRIDEKTELKMKDTELYRYWKETGSI